MIRSYLRETTSFDLQFMSIMAGKTWQQEQEVD